MVNTPLTERDAVWIISETVFTANKSADTNWGPKTLESLVVKWFLKLGNLKNV